MTDGWVTQMRKGLAELVVLIVLARGESYGYEILNRIRKHPALAIKEGTLYLLLGRLKKDGFVTVRKQASDIGPPRRYFRLPARGVSRLADMSAYWNGLARDVQNLYANTDHDND